MRKINNINASPSQTLTVALDSNSSFTITIRYMPRLKSFYITNLVYNDFIVKGIRIYNSQNILHAYSNIIPFGLACYSNEKRDPSLIQDFESGFSSLYVLSYNDLEAYRKVLQNA